MKNQMNADRRLAYLEKKIQESEEEIARQEKAKQVSHTHTHTHTHTRTHTHTHTHTHTPRSTMTGSRESTEGVSGAARLH